MKLIVSNGSTNIKIILYAHKISSIIWKDIIINYLQRYKLKKKQSLIKNKIKFKIKI